MRHVVVVKPASSGVELVRAAQRRDLTAVVLTGPHGERDAIDATARAGARVVLVNLHDAASVVDVIARIPMIAAVMPGMEYYVETAATIAQTLGLPGIGVDVARRFATSTACAGISPPAVLRSRRSRLSTKPTFS